MKYFNCKQLTTQKTNFLLAVALYHSPKVFLYVVPQDINGEITGFMGLFPKIRTYIKVAQEVNIIVESPYYYSS